MTKRYSAWKDSGIEWIGEIPEHWEVKRIKLIATILNGSTPKDNAEYWDGEIEWLTPSDIGKNNDAVFIDGSSRKITSDGLNSCGCNLAPAYSILLTTRAPIGNIAIPVSEFATNQGCKSLVVTDCSNFYLFYYLSVSTEELGQLGQGTTFKELSTTSLANFPVALPTIAEQSQIVEFLDRNTALIDRLIAAKERRIELLKEQRTALINHAVTKGLDPNVKMKDSGIEWIGEIPEHWEVKKMKYGVSNPSVKSTPDEGDIKISPENVESGTGVCSNLYSDYEGEGFQFLPGDVLFNKLRLYLKKIFLAESDGYSMGEMIVLRCNSDLLNKYFYFLLFNQGLIDLLDSQSTGIKMPRVSPETIMNSEIVYPPYFEQQQIVTYLNAETQKIDSLVSLEQKKIDLLIEYRQALISEAVTGKIKVTKE